MNRIQYNRLKKKRLKRHAKLYGFTLTELLASIVIMAILIGIAIPIYFNVSKNAKENEYNSKKNYLESLGQRYAEENNLSATTKISVSRLIASGYTTAEKYVTENNTDIPFISNPMDSEENLACRIIDLSVDNYEFSASLEDTSDCSFAVSDLIDSKIGMKAYEFDGYKIGNQIPIAEDTTLNWSNSDVLVVINPEYGMDEIKSMTLSSSGSTVVVDKNVMLRHIEKDMNINPNDYTNVMLISASSILKQEVTAIVELESTIKNTSMTVRIDKEAPTIDTQRFTGWTSSTKGATIYLSDGNGSGSKGIYVSETDDFSNTGSLILVEDEETVHIKDIYGDTLKNQRYYLWAVDEVDNVSKVSYYIDIENIDDDAPVVTSFTITSKKTTYNTASVSVKVLATDYNGSGVTQICIIDRADPSYCAGKWMAYGSNSFTNDNYSLNTTEGSGASIKLYAYVKDAVENISANAFESNVYNVYKKCDQVVTPEYGQCSKTCGGGTQSRNITDKYLGTVCNVDTKSCNEFDCCSSVNYSSWSSCSVACGAGTQTRTKTSAYNGQSCGTETKSCTAPDCCSKVNYGAWSSCSVACGVGVQTRTKTSAYNGQSCGTETVNCTKPDCCSSTRTTWGGCQGTCGTGTQYGTKYSNYNGQNCGSVSQSCSLVSCCASTYISWGACSASCNGGTQTGTYISNYNGQSCGTTSQSCNTQACPSWHDVDYCDHEGAHVPWTYGYQTTLNTLYQNCIDYSDFDYEAVWKSRMKNTYFSCDDKNGVYSSNSDDTIIKKCSIDTGSFTYGGGTYKFKGSFNVVVDTTKAGDKSTKVKDRYFTSSESIKLYQYY